MIRVRAEYSSTATDHRVIYTCDEFEIEGIDVEEEVESLRWLDECPSQGVSPIIDSLMLDLRNTLQLDHWYTIDLKVVSDRDGRGAKTFFFDSALRHRLRVDAGDFDDV